MSSAASPGGSASRTPVDELGADERARYEALLEDLAEVDPKDAKSFDELVRGDDGGPQSGEDLVEAMDSIDELVAVLGTKGFRSAVDEAELLDHPNRYKRAALLPGDVPGFGESERDCGRPIPESLHACHGCGKVYHFKHNCYRYDCPVHGLHGVRRRAAGSSSMPGAVAKQGAIRATLHPRWEQGSDISHITLNLPRNYFFKSDEPFKAVFRLARAFMDTFDGQGMAVLHDWKTPEDVPGRGFWKTVLGVGLEFDEVREQLVFRLHLHLFPAHPHGAAPGGAVTKAVEVLTRRGGEPGVVIDRIGSVREDEALARALPYALSHARVYETDEQRRLAARFLGPDVNDVEVYEHDKERHRANVHEAAETVLGTPSVDLECNEVLDEPDDVEGPAAPASRAGAGDDRWSFSPARSSGAASSGGPPGAPVSYDAGEPDEPERCGGEIGHISTFDAEEIVALEAQDDDLGTAYTSYQKFMEGGGRDPSTDGRPEVPEFADRPPPG